MIEKTLVPLDGSKLSEAVLPWAEEISGRMGSSITIIHVSEMAKDPRDLTHQTYIQYIVNATKQGAIERSVKLGGSSHIDVQSEILSGNPAEKIVEYAEEVQIGLIVMATHGRSGISRWTLGSVADKVVRATTRPILLIRSKDSLPEAHGKGILNKILVTLDGSENAKAIIPYIEEFALGLKAEVLLLQAVPKGYQVLSGYIASTAETVDSDMLTARDHLDKVAAQLKEKGITVTTEIRLIIDETHAAEEIIDFASQTHADLVAMSTHGRSGISRWAFGSVAERVLREGDTPLLLVRALKSKKD